MVLPGFHEPNEIKLDSLVNSRYNPSKPTTLIVGEVEEISQQATLRQGQRTMNPSSTRRSEGTIFDASGLCLHSFKRANQQEVAGSHNTNVHVWRH
eukprot:165248-Amphidinium_carterae.1